MKTSLPPGQIERADLPRFGLLAFASRFPSAPESRTILITGDAHKPVTVENITAALPRVEQVSDFHCVTTWSCRALRWGGVRFSEFYSQVVVPQALPHANVRYVVIRGQDGYRSILPLADLLADDVLLADRLNGQPLSVAHGAPLRLVTPAHYGYKNVKHIHSMEFLESDRNFTPVGQRFMAHPRARVALEERGIVAPAWLLRALYRPMIAAVANRFAAALAHHEDGSIAATAEAAHEIGSPTLNHRAATPKHRPTHEPSEPE